MAINRLIMNSNKHILHLVSYLQISLCDCSITLHQKTIHTSMTWFMEDHFTNHDFKNIYTINIINTFSIAC